MRPKPRVLKEHFDHDDLGRAAQLSSRKNERHGGTINAFLSACLKNDAADTAKPFNTAVRMYWDAMTSVMAARVILTRYPIS